MPQFDNSIPIDALKWKTVSDFQLRTILGVDICTVEMLDSDEFEVLRPGEDDRIRRAQIKLFCDWLVEEKEQISPEQLRYILSTLEISQAQLARAMLLTEGAISQFLSGSSKWKSSHHRQLALLVLGELSTSGLTKRLASHRPPIDGLIDLVPYRMLVKNGWLQGSSEIGGMKAEVLNFFNSDHQAIECAYQARFRASNSSKIDPIRVGCWFQHLKNKADKDALPSYSRLKLQKSVSKLLDLTVNPEEVSKCAAMLNECGVHLFIEPKPDKTSFDGAAFFHHSNPIIGLTLRYKRIDYFWFTLFHEIAHLVLDHDMSLPRIDQDSTKSDDPDEVEANRWASDRLLPQDIVTQFETLNGSVESRVQELAKRHKRHAGIVLGRLQFERAVSYKVGAKLKVSVAEYFW